METNWSRAADHCLLDLAEINGLIVESGMAATAAKLLQGGKANTNYHLNLQNGTSAVLRIYQRAPQIAEFERAVTNHVVDKIPVPHFLHLDPEQGYALTTWLEGETIESLAMARNVNVVDLAAPSIGSALATISANRFTSSGFLSPGLHVVGEWASTVDGLNGYLFACLGRPLVAERAGENLVRKIETHVRSIEPQLRSATETACLVHGDFKASNLLVKNGALSGVLDWEFAHSGTFLLDIGQLFRHADCLGPKFESGFVRGFQEAGGQLPDAWLLLARAVDLVSLVDFLGRESSGPLMVDDVVRLITGTVSPCQ